MHEATIVLPGGHTGFAIPQLEKCYLVVTQQYSLRLGKWGFDTRSVSSVGSAGYPGVDAIELWERTAAAGGREAKIAKREGGPAVTATSTGS